MKNNVAGRLHKTLLLWNGQRDDRSAREGWSIVLGLKVSKDSRFYLAVFRKLNLLMADLDHLRDQLKSGGLPEDVYAPHLASIEQALSPALVVNNAVHVKQYLRPEVFTALTFCSAFLPEEEVEISQEEFAEIVSLVNSLELFLGECDLPSSLVALIRRHIREAELALAEYPLRGAAALKDAMKAAIGDLIVDQVAYEQLPPEAVGKLKALWSHVNKVVDGAIKVEGLIQVAGRAKRVLEYLQS